MKEKEHDKLKEFGKEIVKGYFEPSSIKNMEVFL